MSRRNTDGRAPRTGLAMRPKVSIVIKALNEEQHIAASVASAVAAAARVGGEVILADSGSSDRTVEIARRYPITIVQLADFSERRCGIGPQLGFQFARGDFVYVLDGDMELEPDFLPAAVAELEHDPRLAAVGGLVEECSTASYQFRGRQRRGTERVAQDAGWLDMGGLYRVEALREVGHLSNRNLHSFEELELGLRLSAADWKLRRIAVPAVRHHGRTEDSLTLLARRWQSRYLDGSGELLRVTLGRAGFRQAVRTQRHLLVALGLWLGFGVASLALPRLGWPMAVVAGCVALLVGVRAWRSGSLSDALVGQLVWQISALALVRGFLARQQDPDAPIAFRLLARPDPEQERRLAVPSDAT